MSIMIKKLLIVVFTLLLAGCAGQAAEEPETGSNRPSNRQVKLDDLGPAPELENEIWLNTDQPLRMADLRGKVVLLDMWTFG